MRGLLSNLFSIRIIDKTYGVFVIDHFKVMVAIRYHLRFLFFHWYSHEMIKFRGKVDNDLYNTTSFPEDLGIWIEMAEKIGINKQKILDYVEEVYGGESSIEVDNANV